MVCGWPKAVTRYNQSISYPRVCLWYEPAFSVGFNVVQVAPGKLMTFIHLAVRQWSLSVLKRLLHIWPSIREQLPPILYAQGDVTDAKWIKLVRQFGFQPLLDDCPCSDGSNRQIFVHFRGIH